MDDDAISWGEQAIMVARAAAGDIGHQQERTVRIWWCDCCGWCAEVVGESDGGKFGALGAVV